ncbi:SDR family NAD(P)-dependent oxidoreductase [Massilia glaciei]|uniref:SDR family NAD(P)-dependent oxidoreductase n=1 Tax=Massilia glaciei TaxID=1524097 RepID=A0A2U2I6X0_9BURK|nr:SDR family oxidoreductase [Massilia glaciei]PWF55490.1 SDR family NAD(P)-dependent oxidoreductase [Massilia glaciei]
MKNTDNRPLQDRVAIITGAARGIGLAAVDKLAKAGASIVAFDLTMESLDDAAELAHTHDVPFLAFRGRVERADDWQRVTIETMNRFGRIDILVNNAGISGPIGSLFDCTEELFDQVMAINAKGVFLGMKHAGAAMKANGGSIVNISSVSGLGGGRFTIAYTASKHAVVGMTKLAASELAAFKIRVNAVCPAPTATEMMFSMEREQSPGDPAAVRRGMSRLIPLGRYGEPEEIGDAILFLAGDTSSFISGAAIPVDGGLKAS